MRKKITLSTLALSFIFIMVACKKDGAKGPLDGNWTFTSMQVQDSSSDHYNDGNDELTTSTLYYTTKNNKGSVTISGGTMAYQGLSYSVDTVMSIKSYTDGTMTDELSSPFTFTLPSTSAASTFKIVGTDSIYFPSGGLVSIGGMTTTTTGAGYKYVLSGNTLTMTTHLVKDSTDNSNGFPEQLHQDVKAAVTLTRQ
jgi:hypothetical protein